MQVGREIFCDDLINVAPVTEIARYSKGPENESDQENGRIKKKTKPMTVPLKKIKRAENPSKRMRFISTSIRSD